MCKKLLILALVLCVGGSVSAKCIAWWTFDNAAALGQAKIGQSSPNVWGGASQGVGVKGGSFKSDGTGYIFYGASWAGAFLESLRQPQFSASYWIKLDGSKGAWTSENIVFSGQQTDYGAWALMSTHVSPAGNGAVAWLYGTDAWYYGYAQIIWWAASMDVYKANNGGTGSFQLYTETFDMNYYGPTDGRMQMYIGQTKILDARLSCGGIMTPITYFAIGARPWGSDSLKGELDDLRFYDEVVPEPMTVALLGLGGLFLRRRK